VRATSSPVIGRRRRSLKRDRQRGSIVVVAMLALLALVSMGALTALSVQGGLSANSADRFKSIALYAAESGAAAATDYLRKNVNATTGFAEFVEPNNTDPQAPTEVYGNGVLPGEEGNLFAETTNAWYEVVILNNPTDSGFAAGDDDDKRVIIQSTGHGPNGTIARIEVEIAAASLQTVGRPCPTYGQKGLAEDGAGRNDCLANIDYTNVETYRPGD
jgi:hypothetical protein